MAWTNECFCSVIFPSPRRLRPKYMIYDVVYMSPCLVCCTGFSLCARFLPIATSVAVCCIAPSKLIMNAAILLPGVLTAASLVAPCYLGLLKLLDESYAGGAPLPAVFKALGAASLFAGHAALAARKPKLPRGDKCYLAGVSCLFALFFGGCVGVKVPLLMAAVAGLIVSVTFADMAAGATRQTRLILRVAIACGCCGCALLLAVGLTGKPAAAQAASVAFLVANSLVLVALHSAPIQARQAQALKVIGSACLFSGNAIGLGWHELPPAGVVGGVVAETLHGLGGLAQVVVAGGGLLVAYAAAVFAASEPKLKAM